MAFFTGNELTAKIQEIVDGKDVRMAVAFWGHGAMEQLGIKKRRGWKIICNLSLGGTNPDEIRKLENPRKAARKKIRHNKRLHAKVYLNSLGAVVTSANASANGLTYEGPEELGGWIEAGVIITDEESLEKIKSWFDNCWKQSKPITNRDLALAEKLLKRRKARKTPLGELASISPEADDFPLISWYGNFDWNVHEENVKAQLGNYNREIEERINCGIELEHQDDMEFLRNGRWILTWQRNDDGTVSREERPEWTQVDGELVKKAYFYTEDPNTFYHAVLAVRQEHRKIVPFTITPEIHTQIADLLDQAKYDRLRTNKYKGAWFTPRIELMRQFWRDLKNAVKSSPATPARRGRSATPARRGRSATPARRGRY